LKRLFPAVLLPLTLLSGCATFTPYSIDEATIESEIQQRVARFGEQQRANGSPLTLKLERAHVTLGPDDRQVAVVDLAGTASVEAFMATIPVGVEFTVEGTPVYDGGEKAVFIRNLKLLSSRVDTQMGSLDLTPYGGMLTDIASQLLDEHPVYRLNEEDMGQRLFGMMNLGIEVRPGRIALVPAGGDEDEVRGPVR